MIRSFQVTLLEEVNDFRDRLQDGLTLTVYIDGKRFDQAYLVTVDYDKAFKMIKSYQVFSQLDVDIYDYNEYEKFFRNWDLDAEESASEK